MYKTLLLLIIIIILFIFLLTYFKGNLLYQPAPSSLVKYNKFYKRLLTLTEDKNNIIKVGVKTPDNIILDTIYIKNPDSTKTIIFFHGNAGNLSMRFDMIKFLYNYASVIIFDYRSYGKSTKDPTGLSSKGLHTDAETIWSYATNILKIKPSTISLFGESLGCSLAIYLASNISKKMNSDDYPHSLILNSPFSSLSSVIRLAFDKFNIRFVGTILAYIVGNEYQSDNWIRYVNFNTKIIIAHSLRDEVVPYTEGQNLFNVINQNHPFVKFINITGTHNNLGLTDTYVYALADIFDE